MLYWLVGRAKKADNYRIQLRFDVVALSGKRSLVTGATGGLGREIAIALDRVGCRLFLTGRNPGLLAEVAASLPHGASGSALTFAADLRKPAELDALVAAVRETFGTIEVLVNVAGIFPVRPLVDTDDETFDTCMQLHVTAPFRLSRAFAGDMVAAGWGRIINIASSSAYAGFRNTAAYCASKHALLGLSRAMHDELKHANVRVYCFSPGSIRTKMARISVDQDYATFLDPVEIADFIVDVASHDGLMMTEEIRLNRMVTR
ncbi:MAG: SDR family NAD(P)-dependent oxidoreductase [Planctomycetota bacterium]|nr:SDR family NAD(P)-dependent oxidoreductase [Planctomycetota bacterium]